MENNDILANLGYTKKLYILPFDHRTGLYKEFDWTEPLSDEQIATMKDDRKLIFEAINHAISLGIPKENTPIFTEDIFGSEVLSQAKQEGFTTFLTTEKSGSPYFNFEHGNSFGDAIEKIKPTAVKALVRYNPNGDKNTNKKSLENLKRLSYYAHHHGYKFLIEPLVTGTDTQLHSVGNNNSRYDYEIRPDLTTQMIREMHAAGIEPDIWKIEGFENTVAYAMVVAAARADGRDNVGVICLGRNETDAIVESWLRAAVQVPGMIGFAIGRTIFLDSLKKYHNKEITRNEAIKKISERFFYFYNLFTGK